MSKEYVKQLEETIANLQRDNHMLKERLNAIENVNPNEALDKLKDNTEMFDKLAKENDDTYKEDAVIEAYVYHFNNIVIERALQRFVSIQNATPVDVMRCLDNLEDCANGMKDLPKSNWIDLAEDEAELDLKIMDWVEKIKFELFKGKQAFLKSQDLEKEIAYIEKVKTMMKQKDCVLRYFEGEDCFAVKTILSDGWYKLTSEFVDNNVREEIKPLPIIEKNKELREENVKYKKAVETIKKKCVNNDNFYLIKVSVDYEHYCQMAYNGINNITMVFLKEEDLIDKEEFDLLKEVFKDENSNK